MAFGWSRLPTPMVLDPYGVPGCALHISLDAVAFFAGSNGQATFAMPIPLVQSLVGVRFFQQAFVVDPGAGNPLGAVVSGAAEGVIGGW
ncbi:MAG: hypothetical protein FJ265_02470 [Planctomycetes bacterium]|nr:hypothetical protein [Planctomycetota bacterium]